MAGSGGGVESAGVFAVVEDVVDRVGVPAFFVRFFGKESLLAAIFLLPAIDHGMGFPRAGRDGGGPQPEKAGPFKERVDVAHLRQCFNPRIRAQFATSSNKTMCNSGTAERRMKYDTRQSHELTIQRP